MKQPPSSSDSPPDLPPDQPPRRRRHAVLSLGQFVLLSSGMAIAILVGGLWLLHWVTQPRQEELSEVTTSGETDSEAENSEKFRLPQTDSTLTTDLLPEIALDDPSQGKTIEVQKIWRYRYNVALLPEWTYSDRLQTIVDEIKQLAIDEELPPDAMSLVIIDLNQGAIAYHRPEVPQYPASVAKLFWMVALYGQFQQGLLPEKDFQDELRLMVSRSDNNAASYIVDAITRTQFQVQGSPEDYEAWHLQRQQLNLFFSLAGYKNLNITQKTYPIPDIDISEPLGFDLQMRQNKVNPNQPIRNQLSAWHAARMMYEIASLQAIAPDASTKMLEFLRRDLQQNWQTTRAFFNPVQDFFGAGLPKDTLLYSKAGWTSQGRHEVAYIASPDGSQKYILSLFAEQQDYAENRTFFPQVTALTHKKLQKTKNQSR